MSKRSTIFIGKAVKKLAQMRGGGSALPGLVVEKLDPKFVGQTLQQLPLGTVVVSGTNGKTTTTKMIVELLEGQGLRVFTNRTGSNFIRGVASGLLEAIDQRGLLRADIAVLELDEAHAVHFVRTVKPRFSVLLNVMRDQLDRFGEIDTTAQMLRTVAQQTREATIVNREDPRLRQVASELTDQKIVYFGLSKQLLTTFPSDDDMRRNSSATTKRPSAEAVLESFDTTSSKAIFTLRDQTIETELKLRGIYNIYNATAAISLVSACLSDKLNFAKLTSTLASITPAFGRGEQLIINNQPCELVLVKNPAGFRLSLASFKPDGYATMIAINDNYADGRDMSWLWDVDFDSLQPAGVCTVSGIRAYDMALRLQYDEVTLRHVDTNLQNALMNFLQHNPNMPKRIYCTYTCMLALRRQLANYTTVERAIK